MDSRAKVCQTNTKQYWPSAATFIYLKMNLARFFAYGRKLERERGMHKGGFSILPVLLSVEIWMSARSFTSMLEERPETHTTVVFIVSLFINNRCL